MTGVFFARDKGEKDAGWSPLIVLEREKRDSLEEEGRPVKFGAGFAVATGGAKMPRGLPTRRGLQALALVLATAYATILLYQAVAPRQVIIETFRFSQTSPQRASVRYRYSSSEHLTLELLSV